MNPIKRLPPPPASPSAQGKPGRRFGFYIGFYIALSILLLVTGTGSGQGSGWRWLTGGNLQALQFVGQKGWIFGEDGNRSIILHTTDGGNHWDLQQHTATEVFMDLSSALFFLDEQNGWIVGNEYGAGFILHTTNGGSNWIFEQGPGLGLRSVYAVDSFHIWVSKSDTIWRSTDGGNTWLGSYVEPGLFGFVFLDSLVGYGVVSKGVFELIKSTDGGQTWNHWIDYNKVPCACIDMVDTLHGWAVGDPGAIVRSTDSWQTWTQVPCGGGSFLRDVSFYDTLTGFMVGGDNRRSAQYYKTTDGGLTWVVDSCTQNNAFNAVDAKQLPQAWITGTGGSILKTTTSGNNWAVLRNVDIGNTSLYNVNFFDTNKGWAVGSYGVITHTVNGGTVWQRQTSNVVSFLMGVSFADSQYGKICTDGGGVLGTRNGGNTWAGESTGAASPLWSIDYPDTSLAVAVGGYYGPLGEKPEGGRQKAVGRELLGNSEIASSSRHGPPRNDTLSTLGTGHDFWKRPWKDSLISQNPTTAYRTITRTTNGGATWIAQNTNANPLYGVKFITRGHGWACGAAGTVIHTTDGGATWQSQTTGISDDLLAITFYDTLHGWTCGGGHKALWTTDGGNHWNIGNGLPNDLASCAFYDTLNGFGVDGNGTIDKTTDGGRNWVSDTSNVHANFTSVFALDSTHVWTVGSFGMVLGWGEAGQTGIEERVQGVEGSRVQETTLGQSYPNPTTGIASFEYELGKAGKVRVKVYNVAGQAVRTLVEGLEPAGKHVVTWDGKDEAGRRVVAGMYFYRMEAGDRKATRKMIVIR